MLLAKRRQRRTKVNTHGLLGHFSLRLALGRSKAEVVKVDTLRGLAFGALAVLTATPSNAAPVLLRPPIPTGLIFPEPNPPPPILSFHAPGAVICFIQDVDTNGNVSTVATLYRRGVPRSVLSRKRFPDQTGYRHPAMLNGKPVSVRLISTYLYDADAKATADRKCSWNAYDRWHAANSNR